MSVAETRAPVQARAIRLPLPPSANKLWQPCILRGKPALRCSPEYTAWQWEAWASLRQQDPPHLPNGDYEASFVVPMRRDIDNSLPAVLDLLARHSITPNDKFCVRMTAEKRRDVPAGECFVTVEAVA